ncbi:MAG: ribosome maturation factor RimM [Salibacteraceae bacterium]
MKRDNCFFLGRISKPHGLKGEVLLKLDVDDLSRYQGLDAVFVAFDSISDLIPFFIERIDLRHRGQAVVRFEDIATLEDAQRISGAALFLPLSALPPLSGNQFYYHEIIGFQVIDSVFGSLGKIDSIIEQGPQAIASVLRDKDTEVLIPLVDEVINRVDRDLNELHVTAPEGLIDLYLN